MCVCMSVCLLAALGQGKVRLWDVVYVSECVCVCDFKMGYLGGRAE